MGAPMIYRVTQTRELLWFSADGREPSEIQAEAAFGRDGGDPSYVVRPDATSDLYSDHDLIHHAGREDLAVAEAKRLVVEAAVES